MNRLALFPGAREAVTGTEDQGCPLGKWGYARPRMKRTLCLIGLALLTLLDGVRAAEPVSLQPKAGDRVVLIGSTFIERDVNFGYLETALTQAWPGEATFRNLAWSADTVFGTARSYFGPPAEGMERLKKHLTEVKPSVIISCYGAAESWEGKKGVEGFKAGYGRLLDVFNEQAPGVRVVLMSPPPCENAGGNLPDQSRQNENLALYRDAIREVAAARGLVFADLFGPLLRANRTGLTENGIHYSENGYRAVAPFFLSSLGMAAPAEENEGLRKLVREKNTLFFHRWRPANETYLFGFRKHEQGNNGAEMPMFDPLIAEKEKAIVAAKNVRP